MRRTKAEAAETRASILVAAEHLYFEKGVDNTTLDEIASAAGVTRGAIYWHFESKTDLFLELYNSARLSQATSMFELDNVTGERDALAVIETACCDWLDLLYRDEQRQRMITIIVRTNFSTEYEPVLNAMQALDEMRTDNVRKALEIAARDEKLSKVWSPSSAALAAKWLIKGLCWEWLLSAHKFDLAAEGGDSVRRLFASFRQA
jgi:AcrR family transcriptional regulator